MSASTLEKILEKLLRHPTLAMGDSAGENATQFGETQYE
jgi:hypothetical protein